MVAATVGEANIHIVNVIPTPMELISGTAIELLMAATPYWRINFSARIAERWDGRASAPHRPYLSTGKEQKERQEQGQGNLPPRYVFNAVYAPIRHAPPTKLVTMGTANPPLLACNVHP
jgi:hypothetical protein